MPQVKKPIALIILDGWGLNPKEEGNAITQATTPVWDRLIAEYPNTVLKAAGQAVGLPEGQMGNSEVGHLSLGTGRVLYQPLTRINKSIETGEFFENRVFHEAMDTALKKGSSLHFLGFLSDGGVHSHLNHLFALLELAKNKGLEKIYVHAILDGRDTPPRAAKKYLEALESKMNNELGIGKIATVGGRYFGMDRDKRWDRVKKAYDAIIFGEGLYANSAQEAVDESYIRGAVDEFVVPTVIIETTNDNRPEPVATVRDGDVLIFFNFRADRARQITHAILDEKFDFFDRRIPPKVHFVCMMEYEATIQAPIAFPPLEINNTLGEVLGKNNLRQLRIAETEKYAHVTFFFNGELETPNEGETRVLIPSPKVSTYDLQPEMSALEVKDKVIRELQTAKFDIMILNLANVDMVGHTGILDAAVKAVETVDKCLGEVIETILKLDGIALVTADHGNAEQMIYYETGERHTTHTTNNVALILVSHERLQFHHNGGDVVASLCDIAPTILELLGIERPAEMTGTSLIVNK